MAIVVFFVYSLFLDENDIFTMLNQRSQLKELEKDSADTKLKLNETLSTLDKLKYRSEVERFAREKKFFKRDNEDVFVIFYE